VHFNRLETLKVRFLASVDTETPLEESESSIRKRAQQARCTDNSDLRMQLSRVHSGDATLRDEACVCPQGAASTGIFDNCLALEHADIDLDTILPIFEKHVL
jgi:hypothetical protein